MLDDEASYFRELLAEQESAVKRYGRYRTVLLAAGGACVGIAVVWMAAQSGGTGDLMGKFVNAYVPLGGGLITAATSAYPIKEIVARKEKIITYNRLIAIVDRLRGSAAANPDDVAMIREKMRSIVDAITKGC